MKPLLSRFPKGGWRTKAARTHSTSMVRGGHGRCQGRHRAAPAAPWTWVFSGEGAGRIRLVPICCSGSSDLVPLGQPLTGGQVAMLCARKAWVGRERPGQP
jgi:hypothetical protein